MGRMYQRGELETAGEDVVSANEDIWGQGGTADPSTSPDFLSGWVGSANFMRLSSMKAAHVAISAAA